VLITTSQAVDLRPKITVLGCDPGVMNFALAVYGPDGLGATDVIEGNRGIIAELDVFADRFAQNLIWYRPQAVAIERYQLRRGKGFTGKMESVNLMIGVVAEQCRSVGIPCELITASVHKSWAGRKNGATKRKSKLCMHTCPEFAHLGTEHEADAANIAKYVGLKLSKQPDIIKLLAATSRWPNQHAIVT